MKGINKVSRFFRHTLFSILFGKQAMIQRALGIIIGLNHNIPIEKWCLLSGEHTKPQKMKRIHGKREFPTMDVESRRVKPINEMKFPGLRVWVDTFWSIEFWSMNHSWMRLAWVVHRNSFFWLICDQLRVPWLRDACKAAKKKEIGARRLRETIERISKFLASKGRTRQEFVPWGNRRCKTMPENFCGFVFRWLLLLCFSRLHSQMSRIYFSL